MAQEVKEWAWGGASGLSQYLQNLIAEGYLISQIVPASYLTTGEGKASSLQSAIIMVEKISK